MLGAFPVRPSHLFAPRARTRPTGFGSGKRHKAINWQCLRQSLKNDQMSDGAGYRWRRGCSVFIRPTTAPSKIQQRCIIKPLNFDKLALRGPRKIFLSSPMKLSKYFHNVSKCQTNPCLMDYHIVVAPLLRLSPFCNWRPPCRKSRPQSNLQWGRGRGRHH